MKRKLKNKWLDALVSGNYLKGKRHLIQTIDGKPHYCCLGVLGSICGINDETLKNYEDSDSDILPLSQAGGLTVEEQRALALVNDNTDDFVYVRKVIEAFVPTED